MKNLLTIAALAGLMSMPLLGSAQNHDRHDHDRNTNQHRQDDHRKAGEARRRMEQQRAEALRREQQRRIVTQRGHNNWSDHRQDTKNEWRNIAIGAGGLGVLGLLTHDNTLTFVGAAGALYSLDRYEQDRRSQNHENRLRAEYFSRDHFIRDGHQFDRRIVTKNGHRYYQFVRGH